MPEVVDHFEIPHQSGADECQRPTGLRVSRVGDGSYRLPDGPGMSG
jgi:hypothetical protein